ncbi:hypothetical protein [Lentzea flava]|uniref:Uncharacterized protein n=1 Tax=Lentzea flava TaxID=103732 RepID=A0ABQ2V0S7_9PSEU|nr:hypothetical protein [Lentzea flava]MCP2202714.1 hypothetical protein [Lentzea flava]GGU61718.1 hypothetical protein GCM10010178_62370 [Lentzea flava]
MPLPTADTSSLNPTIELVRAGVVEPHIAAALDAYASSMAAYRAAVEAARLERVDRIPPDADAELVAKLIVDARERDAAPGRAREALLGALAAHHGDWVRVTAKELTAARARLIKTLGTLIEQLSTYHALAGTEKGIADGPRFRWVGGYDGSGPVHTAHSAAEALHEHLRAADPS